MKKIIIAALAVSCTVSCTKESGDVTVESQRTILMYLPWSGDLTAYFRTNISDFSTAIAGGVLKDERVVVIFSESSSAASLFELRHEKGKCISETLKEYSDPEFTTAAGITGILNDVKKFAPAGSYSMIIGCHGMGWIPAADTRTAADGEKEYWEYGESSLTRWFGGTSVQYRTDISTLAEGIRGAGITMEYILFDDCYMSTIEVAYELRHVAGHIIASPNEVMKFGMPYADMAYHLTGKVDYKAVAESFVDFYRNYSYPHGTIAVTVCSELDALASVMREINSVHELDPALLGSIQVMDGYSPTRFFDYGDYVEKLCTDQSLMARFEAQLERTIPSRYRKHTDQFYTNSRGPVNIHTFTGITVSDPSTSPATAAKTGTAWYLATH